MKNVVITAEVLRQIRALDDFDLTMLISEINDHGWAYGENLLKLMLTARPVANA